VNLVIQVEQGPLGRRVGGKRPGEPLVQRSLGLILVGELAGVCPPLLKVTPPQAVTADGPIVDEDLVGILNNLDVVADGVDDPDVRLDLGGEDEVFRLSAAR
jgi:hypothetical protein